MWAVVIMGILPTIIKQAKYCTVEIDYITKWVEACRLVEIIEEVEK